MTIRAAFKRWRERRDGRMRRCRERWQEGTDEIEERASEGERERTNHGHTTTI